LEPAPFRTDLAEGGDAVRAYWRRTADDAQLRIAVWSAPGARGTILLFPGRTEYVEKYGRIARELTAAGYAVAAIDWRGQGFSDRLADDRLLGHVLKFRDYQHDVAALTEAVDTLGLPGPRYLLAHSMGGCIGLRALTEGLAVRRAVFSAPMWGIQMPAAKRPVAAVLPGLARLAGQAHRYTPGSRPVIYDMETGFASNPLTSDPDHFAYLARQLAEEEAFALGGPSLHWLGEALAECRMLRSRARPDLPVLTFLGTEETIVVPGDIERMHRTWPSATLHLVPGARHEFMMEAPHIRSAFLAETLGFFDAERGA
jgi:lysophospholipase